MLVSVKEKQYLEYRLSGVLSSNISSNFKVYIMQDFFENPMMNGIVCENLNYVTNLHARYRIDWRRHYYFETIYSYTLQSAQDCVFLTSSIL